jgi:battenin
MEHSRPALSATLIDARAPSKVSSGTFALCYSAALLCGILNNAGFCVITAAAQDLSAFFGTENLVSAYVLVMDVAWGLGTAINARWLIRFSPWSRVVLLNALLVAGYSIAALSCSWGSPAGFAVALAGSVGAGFAQAIGEVTNLAFLKAFPRQLLGAWGAGTGLAGLAGPGFYLLLSSLGVSTATIFIACAPSALVYLLLFRYLVRVAATLPTVDSDANGCDAPPPPASLTVVNARRVFASAGAIILHLVFVYFCEYSIYPSLVDRDTHFVDERSFVQRNAYVLAWICYNIGVTISRMSVSFVEIRRLWLLSLLQGCNLVLWFVEATTHAVRGLGDRGYWLLLAWMVWVGLMGGTAYINSMQQMNKSDRVPDEIRELGTNVCFMLINLGIISSTLLFMLLDSTILSLDRLYPNHTRVV